MYILIVPFVKIYLLDEMFKSKLVCFSSYDPPIQDLAATDSAAIEREDMFICLSTTLDLFLTFVPLPTFLDILQLQFGMSFLHSVFAFYLTLQFSRSLISV